MFPGIVQKASQGPVSVETCCTGAFTVSCVAGQSGQKTETSVMGGQYFPGHGRGPFCPSVTWPEKGGSLDAGGGAGPAGEPCAMASHPAPPPESSHSPESRDAQRNPEPTVGVGALRGAARQLAQPRVKMNLSLPCQSI